MKSPYEDCKAKYRPPVTFEFKYVRKISEYTYTKKSLPEVQNVLYFHLLNPAALPQHLQQIWACLSPFRACLSGKVPVTSPVKEPESCSILGRAGLWGQILMSSNLCSTTWGNWSSVSIFHQAMDAVIKFSMVSVD